MKRHVTATEAVADSLLQNGEKGTLLLSKIGLLSLQNAISEDGKTLKIKDLSDIGDVMTAGKAVRLAAGMDKQPAVTVNVGGMFGAMAEGMTVEVESAESQEE